MRRNLILIYILSFLINASFWISTWLLYYLNFTNYAGVGLLETIWVTIALFGEIPTGAIADLLGKKTTLIIAFLFNGLGNLFMATATSFHGLVPSLIVWAIGGILYSGTYEAFIYDFLKEHKQENLYSRVLSNTQTISLIAMAIGSIVGGFFYKQHHNWPFFLTAIFYFLAFILSFFLKEPSIDSNKFTLKNYLNQTRQGIIHLFNRTNQQLIITLLIMGALYTILYEAVGDALVIEFGFRNEQLGIFYAVLFAISAFGVQLTSWFKKKFGIHKSIILIGLIFSITLMTSPFIYLFWGGVTAYIRATLGSIMENMTSEEINRDIPSKYRTTTLSTFSMLKLLPYALFAVLVGHLMDIMTARVFAFYFGIVFGIVILIYIKFAFNHIRD